MCIYTFFIIFLFRKTNRRSWLDGIVLSREEPTCVPDLENLLADLKTIGLPVKVDSNGSAPDVLERLLVSDLAQTLAVDVKGPWNRYPELTIEDRKSVV